MKGMFALTLTVIAEKRGIKKVRIRRGKGRDSFTLTLVIDCDIHLKLLVIFKLQGQNFVNEYLGLDIFGFLRHIVVA